jgi:hypothetical protein
MVNYFQLKYNSSYKLIVIIHPLLHLKQTKCVQFLPKNLAWIHFIQLMFWKSEKLDSWSMIKEKFQNWS